MVCHQLISDKEIDNSFNVHKGFISCKIKESDCHSDDCKYAKLYLYVNSYPILRKDDYSYYEYKKIDNKKIVFIGGIRLQDDYQNNGIMTDVLNKNTQVFRKNKFSQVRLHAIQDGILVWPRLGFMIMKKQHSIILLTKARLYLATVRNIPHKELKYKSINEINNNLLKSNESYPMGFTEWYSKQPNPEYIEMVKEL